MMAIEFHFGKETWDLLRLSKQTGHFNFASVFLKSFNGMKQTSPALPKD